MIKTLSVHNFLTKRITIIIIIIRYYCQKLHFLGDDISVVIACTVQCVTVQKARHILINLAFYYCYEIELNFSYILRLYFILGLVIEKIKK